MKLYKTFILSIAVAILSLSFTSCDDDNEKGKGEYNPKELLLPLKITESYNHNTNDHSEYSFIYDITDTTRITSYTMVEHYSVNNIYTTTINIKYNSNGQITETEELVQNNHTKYTYTYAQQKANGTSYTVISKKNEDGIIIAIYTVDKYERLVSSQEELEYSTNDTDFYQYSGNNISKATTKEKLEINDQPVVVRESTISYNTNNGVFRNVTTPQWFLITELDDLAIGQTQNNVSKANIKIYDYDKATTPVIVNETLNTTYKSFIQNFPNKFELEVLNNEGEKDKKTFYEVMYNFVK